MENKELKVCSKCKKELDILEFNKCDKNKDGLQSWCKSCYKEYIENKKGYYLYIVEENNFIKYVGATEILNKRLSDHLNGHTNIKDLIKSNKWTSIKYIDLGEVVKNREEMLLLENSLIQLYETEYNNKLSIIRNVDKFREFELLAEVHSLNKNWLIYVENDIIIKELDKTEKGLQNYSPTVKVSI